MIQNMKTQIVSTALFAIILVVSVSGCAALPSTKEIGLPTNGKTKSVEMKFGMARLLERQGKLTEARNTYLEILSSQSHPESLHRLGVTEIRQNRVDAGLKLLSQAAADGDASAELLGDYGYAQFLAGDLTTAEETLKQAVAIDPSQKRNVNNLAIVVGKQGRLEESLQFFRQAGPEAEALANLAFIQSQSEDLGKAKENYSKALDLDPQLKIAAVGLLEVDKHINAQNRVAQAIEPEVQEAPSQEMAVKGALARQAIPKPVHPKPALAKQIAAEDTPSLKKLPLEKLPLDALPLETPFERITRAKYASQKNVPQEKAPVKTVSWNQPATAISTGRPDSSGVSDRVLAKILTPATVAVETNDDIKTANRDNDDVAAIPKASSNEALWSSISKLNVSGAATED
jgi:tetratricopeptide (TPR) repeat protein